MNERLKIRNDLGGIIKELRNLAKEEDNFGRSTIAFMYFIGSKPKMIYALGKDYITPQEFNRIDSQINGLLNKLTYQEARTA